MQIINSINHKTSTTIQKIVAEESQTTITHADLFNYPRNFTRLYIIINLKHKKVITD